MKIQDIKQDSIPTSVTYASVIVKGVSGYSSAISTIEQNITKNVVSVEDETCMRYNGAVEQFRKRITFEDGTILRLFWFNGKQDNQIFTAYRKAL